MKQILLLVLFFSAQINLSAQTNTYYAFPDSNATWVQTHCDPAIGNCYVTYYTSIITIAKDTVMQNYTYKKLYMHKNTTYYPTSWTCTTPAPSDYYDTYGFYRNDTAAKRLYFIPSNFSYWNGLDSICYDFSKAVGDTVFGKGVLFFHNYYVIDSLDSIKIGNSYRRTQYIHSDAGDPRYTIEGIGSNFGIYPFGSNTFESCDNLQCFSQNNHQLYPDTIGFCQNINGIVTHANDNVKIFPNPASDKIYLENVGPNASVKISNVLGGVVKEVFLLTDRIDVADIQEGIYFLDIRMVDKIFERRKIIISR